jgi:sterol desaturase/sphingolipid hydroxylase (fatty acid hydroxylase superfamily)
MRIELIAIFAIYAGFALAEALDTGFFRKAGATRQDAVVEIGGTFILLAMTQPLALAGGSLLGRLIAPGAAGALAQWPILAQLALLLIFDDMMQYWWHRLSHTLPWLYNLHRPHHEAEYMSVRIVYRNNVFYYLLMPSLWLSGLLVYLGLGPLYVVYVVVKMAVIISAHSDKRWDAPLYAIPWLSRPMWLIERIVSTPATHAAHHGKHASDGVTNYKGNFGNLLFFWDVLFGTARITRRYPEKIGVENLPPTTAAAQLLWPLVSAPPRRAAAPRPSRGTA